MNAERLTDRLQECQAGQQIELTIFHGDRLRTIPVILSEPISQQYQLSPLSHLSDRQIHQFKAWMA